MALLISQIFITTEDTSMHVYLVTILYMTHRYTVSCSCPAIQDTLEDILPCSYPSIQDTCEDIVRSSHSVWDTLEKWRTLIHSIDLATIQCSDQRHPVINSYPLAAGDYGDKRLNITDHIHNYELNILHTSLGGGDAMMDGEGA